MKKLELVGQNFGELIVLSYAGNANNTRNWICKCSCGTTKTFRTSSLRSGDAKSCGCLNNIFGLLLKPNQKINRLTTISYKNGFWKCKCECGSEIIVMTSKLVNGNTKSCGCLRQDKSKDNIKKAIKTSTKYDPRISSARRVWRAYKSNDEKRGISFDLDFDSFYDITQKNCSYCGIEPGNKCNGFLMKKDASIYAKENGTFIYNGIDRVDPTKLHSLNNVVPACWTCNRGKSDRLINEFYEYIDNLRINNIDDHEYISTDLPDNIYVLQSIKSAYRTYSNEQISLLEFYSLSQLECFYCGCKNTNKINAPLGDKKASIKAKEQGWFHYNGLDRIDPTLPHLLSNCVPCCYYCNFAKSNNTFDEFQAWIKRIKTFRVAKIAEKTD